MRERNKRKTDEEKKRIVASYLKGHQSLTEAAKSAGVSRRALSYWVSGRYTTSAHKPRYIDVKQKDKNKSAGNGQAAAPASKGRVADPRDAEIARLKKELAKAELRAHALDTMIDVAEETLNIQIRKKAGAKQ